MSQPNFIEDHVSTSKFYMLRCLIAVAHADGIVCDEERAYMAALMNRIPLTEEQRATLESDLDTEQDISLLLAHINDPKYRSQVVYFARLMAYKDGNLSPSEDDLLKKLHITVVDGLDMEAIRKEAHDAVQADLQIHDITINNHRPMKGEHFIPWMQWLDEFLLKMGIDLLRD